MVFQNGFLLDTLGVSAQLDYKVNVGPLLCYLGSNIRRLFSWCPHPKVSGSVLPVEVKSNISDVLLMRVAVSKHSAFHNHLVDASKYYVLVYQDYCIVKYLPGTQQPFILHKYTEMLGKPYHRICFYLCEKETYEGIYEVVLYCLLYTVSFWHFDIWELSTLYSKRY